MLVLTRKTDQSITLGDPTSAEAAIEVTVLEIRDGQVRLGVKAPRDVTVHRKEVWEQVQQDAFRSSTSGVVTNAPMKRPSQPQP